MSDENKGIKIAVVGCLLVFALTCCVCGGMVAMFGEALTGPRDACASFLNDTRDGRLVDARARMGRAYQDTHDQARFEASVAAIPELAGHSDQTLMNINVFSENGRDLATVGGTLSTPAGGSA